MKAEPTTLPAAGTRMLPSPRTEGRKRLDKRDPRWSIAQLFSEER